MKSLQFILPVLLASANVGVFASVGEKYYVVKADDDHRSYSRVPAPAPHRRRDVLQAFYPMSSNDLGTVYSNIAPAERQKIHDHVPRQSLPDKPENSTIGIR